MCTIPGWRRGFEVRFTLPPCDCPHDFPPPNWTQGPKPTARLVVHERSHTKTYILLSHPRCLAMYLVIATGGGRLALDLSIDPSWSTISTSPPTRTCPSGVSAALLRPTSHPRSKGAASRSLLPTIRACSARWVFAASIASSPDLIAITFRLTPLGLTEAYPMHHKTRQTICQPATDATTVPARSPPHSARLRTSQRRHHSRHCEHELRGTGKPIPLR